MMSSPDQSPGRYEQPTLDNCDREPVHLIGSIQPHAALLVLDPEGLELVASSQNAAALLEADLSTPSSWAERMPDIARVLAEELVGRSGGMHRPVSAPLVTAAGTFQAVYHEHAGRGLIEFLPQGESSVGSLRQSSRVARSLSTAILAADGFEAAQQAAVDAVRRISGFARVKLYRFQPDWSGKVVAESREDHMASYLGLCFPDTDIPKQARALMKLVPYRSLADSSDAVALIEPASWEDPSLEVDLSLSLARTSSLMHTEYLRNMQVEGTFTVSLLEDGELWGLFACHHDGPRALPFDDWGVLQDLATTLMAKWSQEQARGAAAMMRDLRDIETRTAAIVKASGSLEDSIRELLPSLRKFMDADGFVFQYGSSFYAEGRVPPDEFIHRLLDWGRQRIEDGETFATHSLHAEFPDAGEHLETSCGVLIEPIHLKRKCVLIWFRGSVTRVVKWAGAPDSKRLREEEDGSVTLMPRRSFATWVKEYRDQSEPWTRAQIAAAQEILKHVLDMVASQIRLERSNRNLETFSYAAAHDLKTPLRHIRSALEMVKDTVAEADAAESERVNELIEMAVSSSDRLRNLVKGMTDYLLLESRGPSLAPLSLEEPLQNALELHRDDLERVGGTFSAEPMPTALGNAELLTALFANLIENSIKYRSAERPLAIRVRVEEADKFVVVRFEDNGQGIPPEHAESVFQPLKRLHGHAEVSGNGLGLTICSRVVELHRGTLAVDPGYGPGACFVARFGT